MTAPAAEPAPAPADVTIEGGKIDTPAGSAPIIPILLIAFGGYLMWFGVKYWRGTGPAVWPSFPIKSVLQGKGLPAPEPAPPVSSELAAFEGQVAANIPAASPGGTVTGSAIATDALRYQGSPYKWGGATPQGWDCSGFVNWVTGHDLNLAIPGQGKTGTGPPPPSPPPPGPPPPPSGVKWWIDNSQPKLPCSEKVFSASGFTPGNSSGPFPTRAAALAACQKAGGH